MPDLDAKREALVDPEPAEEAEGVPSRRSFLMRMGVAGVAATLGPVGAVEASMSRTPTLPEVEEEELLETAELAPPAPPARPPSVSTLVPLTLTINGEKRDLRIDPRASLLDTLRETAQLTGTKKGCDHGQCGACTVHLDGKRVLSCLSLALSCQGQKVTTIEGLGTPEQMHPMQAAFAQCDAFQCGYCTSGQIMSAVALLKEPIGPEDDAVKEAMSGNICRCGAYGNIVEAIQQVRSAGGRTVR